MSHCGVQDFGMRNGVAETRHRQTGDGDDLPQNELLPVRQEKKAHKDSERKKNEDSGTLVHALLEKIRNKALTVMFATASLLALFLLTSSHFDVVQPKLRSEDQKLQASPLTCSEDKVLRWLQASNGIQALKGKQTRHLKVGLVNFRKPNSIAWELFSGGERPAVFKFRPAKNDWSAFFPEQIDEDEEVHKSNCPDMPMPSVPKDLKLDIVVASIPCDSSGNTWSRDINCLQAFLAAAKVAANTGSDFMHVVFCGECRPVPNLFICKELLEHHDGVWLYKVDLKRIQTQLTLPVGSCELAIPVKTKGEHVPSREAYATILHSAESYVCGAITLAHSIRRTGSTRDLVLLVDENIKPEHKAGLESAGWKVWKIERIRNPKAEPSSYNEWNYSKFRLWQLTQYDKLIYIDADIILLRNLDVLFDLPEISATRNHESLFNSGVMVIEPSNCTFEFLVNNIDKIESYNGGDQGYLNEIYTWWHRLPETMNFLKFFDNNTEENERKLHLFTADPPMLHGMHFLGIKPWLCFRDYDCNWNQNQLHIFASDVVHAQWWKLHDTMPQHLQKFCLLQGTQKFLLEWDIRKAKKQRYKDGHWKLEIKDPRWHAVKAQAL